MLPLPCMRGVADGASMTHGVCAVVVAVLWIYVLIHDWRMHVWGGGVLDTWMGALLSEAGTQESA